MNKKLQVFISSTYTDLKEERQAAVQAVLSAGHIPAGMELFTANDQSQKEIIKEWIEESDVYMLILGGRYGSIDGETEKSYTHWEYDYACEMDKPRFSLVLTDEAINQKIEIMKDHKKVIESENPQKHKEFKDNLLNSKLVNMIDDLKDIENSILKSLRKIEKSANLYGWVSGKDVPDVKGLLEENGKLLRENARLISENQKLKEKAIQDNIYNGHSYEDIKRYLDHAMIDLTNCPFYENQENELSVNKLLDITGNFLIVGFPISGNMSEDSAFVYRKLVPNLMKFDLIERVEGTGKRFDRIQFSKLGNKYISQLEIDESNTDEKLKAKPKTKPKSSPSTQKRRSTSSLV